MWTPPAQPLDRGSLEEGKRGDLVVLTEDPLLSDLNALTRVGKNVIFMLGGSLARPNALPERGRAAASLGVLSHPA